MNECLARACAAVAEIRASGHGFDDEIARAVIEAIRDPGPEMLAVGGSESGWRWRLMITELLR